LKEDLIDNGWRCIQEAAECLQHRKVLVTGEWLSLRFLGGKPSEDVHEELVSGRFGSVVRLGDLMMRPTALDYDLSMFIKDVYMIPQEQVEQVLKWLEPEALVHIEQEQKLHAQVKTLKAEMAQAHPARGDDDDPARGDDANLPSEEVLPEAQEKIGVMKLEQTEDEDGMEREIEEVAMQKAQEVGMPKDRKDTWASIQLPQSRAPEVLMKAPSQAANSDAKKSSAATAQSAQSLGLSEEAEVAVKEGEEVDVEEEWSDQDTGVPQDLLESLESEQPIIVSDMQQDGLTTLTGVGPQGSSPVAVSGTGLGALRYAVEKLHPSWRKELEEEFSSEYFMSIAKYLRAEVKLLGNRIYPSPDLIFHAFDLTPFDQVKVVIIGQDPYHGDGQAHGLAFSVPSGISAPPSLQNIFKELKEDPDVDFKPPAGKGGDLSPWAKQGVLLLNTVLTVRAGDPLSHRDFGWEEFTDAAIRRLNDGRTNVIFVLWGANAHKKADIITGETHTVLMSSHPSPLSALKGRTPFLGCRHFSMINRVLRAQGAAEIDWSLS
jgi:uracil-DNA glycosylase